MARSTSWVGLSEAAEKFLREYEFKHGAPEITIYDYWPDPFGQDVELECYNFPNGISFIECVQEDPWSSGPVVFTALKKKKKSIRWVKKTFWKEEEMDEYL